MLLNDIVSVSADQCECQFEHKHECFSVNLNQCESVCHCEHHYECDCVSVSGCQYHFQCVNMIIGMSVCGSVSPYQSECASV